MRPNSLTQILKKNKKPCNYEMHYKSLKAMQISPKQNFQKSM